MSVALLALAAALPLFGASSASALTTPENVFTYYQRVETSGVRDPVTRHLKLDRGLYVIGDSISVGNIPGSGAPYLDTVAAHLQGKAALRVASGFNIGTHAFTTQWADATAQGIPPVTSLQDAKDSDASTVFVELGTNDVSCLRQKDPVLCKTTQVGDSSWVAGQKQNTITYAKSMIDQLNAAGKCVVWAGPREIDVAGSYASDYAEFNTWLSDYAKTKPAKLVYANWDSYVKNTPVLAQDLSGADKLHPHDPKALQALADFAVFYAHFGCKMPLL